MKFVPFKGTAFEGALVIETRFGGTGGIVANQLRVFRALRDSLAAQGLEGNKEVETTTYIFSVVVTSTLHWCFADVPLNEAQQDVMADFRAYWQWMCQHFYTEGDTLPEGKRWRDVTTDDALIVKAYEKTVSELPQGFLYPVWWNAHEASQVSFAAPITERRAEKLTPAEQADPEVKKKE